MKAKEVIREALKKIMDEGEANACQIWKGYGETNRNGWHIARFGKTPTYFGKSVEEVIDAIYDIYDGRESG